MKVEPQLIVPFIYGTFLGSFLNVCIYRLPRSSSIILPGSACTVCKEPIRWWQNLPVLSYIFLCGRCVSCGTSISPRYPFIELLSGILVAYLWHRDSPHLLLFSCDLIFSALLLVITVIDWDFQIILDSMIYLGAVVGLLCSAVEHQLLTSVLAAVGGVLFFYAVRVVGEFVFLKEAMGLGDVKLAAMIGVFLGVKKTAVALFLSFPIGVVLALTLMGLKIKSRKDYIPFGPAMALAAFISAIWGDALVNWYFRWRFGGPY